MNPRYFNQTISRTALLAALACAGLVVSTGLVVNAQTPDSAPASSASAQSGQRTDGQIEMDVVHALDGSRALKNDMITAATIQGEVTLSGTVSSEASRELAESIVGHVNGVSGVKNNLKVGNPQADAMAAQAAPDSQQAANEPDDSMAPIPPSADGPGNVPGQAPYPSQAQPSAGTYPNQQGQYPPQGQPQYPNQGQYPTPPQGQPYPNQPYPDGGRPQYAQVPPSAPRYKLPNGPVTIPQGTVLQVRTSESLDSKRAKDGNPVQFTVIRDVAVNGVLAIPRGATVHGVVTESKQSGDLAGSGVLALRLTSLDLGGHSYDLASDQFKVKGPNKAGQTAGNTLGGALIGAIIGGAVGRGGGAAIGAGAGAAAGLGASAAEGSRGVWIPAEALVTFHLSDPLTVDPVDQQEAARLAQGLYQGGPTLYRRSPYYGGGPYLAAGYPYGYPPVYYRPYYMVGGIYYWR
jgi:hypothetical protein